MAARVGFVGLGTMGTAMASSLIRDGFYVVVWSRNPAHADDVVALGAERAAEVGDAFATGHVFSMLANEGAVRSVFSPEVLEAAPAGSIHVDMATISEQAATEFESAHRENGIAYVAAPVIGRPEVAARGELTVVVAGDPQAVETSRPMLLSMGRRIWDYGARPSDANLAKIAVNYLIIHALQALAESLTLVEHRDLDPHTFIDMINDSVFPGAVYSGYGHAIAGRTYTPPGFTTTLGHKDLMLAVDAAAEAGVELPSAPVLREIFETTIAEGGDQFDWASIAEVTRRRSANGDQRGR